MSGTEALSLCKRGNTTSRLHPAVHALKKKGSTTIQIFGRPPRLHVKPNHIHPFQTDSIFGRSPSIGSPAALGRTDTPWPDPANAIAPSTTCSCGQISPRMDFPNPHRYTDSKVENTRCRLAVIVAADVVGYGVTPQPEQIPSEPKPFVTTYLRNNKEIGHYN